MKQKWKQWIAVLCLLMLLAASLHLARAESAPAQEECAPYRIVLTAPGGWNRSNSAVITVNVKDEQNLGWYQMAYRMNDGDWTDCEQLFDKSKAEIAVHENGMFTFRITDPHGHTFEESTRRTDCAGKHHRDDLAGRSAGRPLRRGRCAGQQHAFHRAGREHHPDCAG